MRRGRLEAADQSTLFLDEIGDINLGLQPKLLRVSAGAQLRAAGQQRHGQRQPSIDLRDQSEILREMVQQGTFREDLYYRLNVDYPDVHLPPLRERRDDIPLLAQISCS